jgi:predicted nicotinamide N-methyase
MMPLPPAQSYQTRLQSVCVAGVEYQLRTLLDVQQFSDEFGEAEALGISPSSWPMFGVIWPCSRVLATHMAGVKHAGKRVLEIGCGLGLTSLSLHAQGANVLASDLHPLAEKFLIRNLLLNDLPPMPFAQCDWEDDSADLGRFDFIIASDLLYEPGQPAAVAAFMSRHAAPGATLVMVDPGRGNLSRFDHELADHRFALSDRFRPNRLKIKVSNYHATETATSGA